MLSFKPLLGLAVLATLVAGCASGPAIVADRDPSADLESYATFAFFERSDTDRNRYSTLVTEHLKRATRAELERLGYVYDESAPALRVNFLLDVQEREELRASPTGLGFAGPRGYRAWGGYDLTTVSYKAGTLRIDLVDVERRALVWQGVAEGTLDAAALENPGAAIGRVVAHMFSNFPGSPVK
jgi:Domain of unknown function (DUF4136)